MAAIDLHIDEQRVCSEYGIEEKSPPSCVGGLKKSLIVVGGRYLCIYSCIDIRLFVYLNH